MCDTYVAYTSSMDERHKGVAINKLHRKKEITDHFYDDSFSKRTVEKITITYESWNAISLLLNKCIYHISVVEYKTKFGETQMCVKRNPEISEVILKQLQDVRGITRIILNV